ncbi:MAG: serine hydrolase, partial [Anaerolineae bacterium]
ELHEAEHELETMLAEAEAIHEQQDLWQGYIEFVLGRAIEPVDIELKATHDRDALIAQLETIASFLDEPAQPPQLLSSSDSFDVGKPGFVADVMASLPEVEAALYRPEDRAASLVVVDQEAPDLDMSYLEANIRKQLNAFSGFSSVFVMDLQTGEEININGDVAVSGLSILKIGIFLETYRVLDGPPNEYVQGLFYDTAVRSSNYAANLLLHVVAGENNTYRGADIFTQSMHRLGLMNTFIAVPYDVDFPPATRPSTYVTPANSQPDLPTRPDTAMQTTAEEMGTLLSMIYYCAKGGGALLAVYPDDITPDECQAIIDLMVLNVEGNIIRFGVPEDVPVSHKHGWDFVTHGDAGIVLSPGGDYVIVEYLSDPTSDWLNYDVSFPIMREISRAVYNYFNFDNPNLEDPEVRAAREAEERERAASEAAGETAVDSPPDSTTNNEANNQ